MNYYDPAYPTRAHRDAEGVRIDTNYGLTIRLEFIKAAMQGLCADMDGQNFPRLVAEAAVRVADATLKAAGVES